MATCRGCGGELGRDCFNEPECMWITADIERRAAEDQGYAQQQAEDEAAHWAALEAEHLAQLKALASEPTRDKEPT